MTIKSLITLVILLVFTAYAPADIKIKDYRGHNIRLHKLPISVFVCIDQLYCSRCKIELLHYLSAKKSVFGLVKRVDKYDKMVMSMENASHAKRYGESNSMYFSKHFFDDETKTPFVVLKIPSGYRVLSHDSLFDYNGYLLNKFLDSL